MTDIFNREKRSSIMSRVKSKNTKPEILVRKFLFSKGIRFRIHDRKLPGNPDIVLKRFSTVIFVNGCFWHGHKCKLSKLPLSNVDFWKQKINKNILKDYTNELALTQMGYNVIRIWGCELRNKTTSELSLKELYDKILNLKAKI